MRVILPLQFPSYGSESTEYGVRHPRGHSEGERGDHHLEPGEKIGSKASAVSSIACNEGAPSRYRLRNANPATISYGAAQGHE